jgi:hypothetical protein
MISFTQTKSPLVVLNNHISVKDASFYSGYNQQYLRCMMRNGKLPAVKVYCIVLAKIFTKLLDCIFCG